MSIKDTPAGFGEYLEILRRRRWCLLTIIPAALLSSVFLAFFLDASYRATSTILLEPSSIPAELVQTTVTSYADQQIELVSRRVLTPANLEQVIDKVDPYPESPELSRTAKAQRIIADTEIERVDPITFDVLKVSNAFSIHYLNQDPERAATVAGQIGELFLGYNKQTRSERAEATYAFLLEQSRDVEQRMRQVDQSIAEFKGKHGSALPEAQVRNQAAAERASRDLMGIEAQMRAAEERQALLSVQLSGINPTLGTTAGNLKAELATLQGQLADARVRYTPDHPDVKRLERQIEALSARAVAEPGAAASQPNNPAYIAVKSQIDATQRELSALQSSANRARSQIYQYESGFSAAPAIEGEYADLTRNRDVLQKQFADIQAKLREADIARNLESEQKGERFTQIRAPSVPKRPFSPNRLGIILLGIILGGGLAVGVAALLESSDPTVRGVRDLASITALPAIGAVPLMLSKDELRRQWVRRSSYALALGAATAFVVASVIFA
jgi:polysaccharide chain length determinant protein (PEP-CTERM system associated)